MTLTVWKKNLYLGLLLTVSVLLGMAVSDFVWLTSAGHKATVEAARENVLAPKSTADQFGDLTFQR